MSKFHSFNQDFFENIDTEEKAYWLGFVTADGGVGDKKGKYNLRIALGIKDIDHLHKIKSALNATQLVKAVIFKNKGINPTKGCYIHFCSKKMVKDLSKYGIVQNKTFTVTPWNGPEHLMRHYWRGMIDGDGYLKCGPKRTDFIVSLCGNHSIVSSFLSYCKTVIDTETKTIRNGSIYFVSISGARVAQKMAEHFYKNSTIHLDRKKELAEKIMKIEEIRRDLSYITEDDLIKRKAEFKNWTQVAKSLGLSYEDLYQVRKDRFGLVESIDSSPKAIVEITSGQNFKSIRDASIRLSINRSDIKLYLDGIKKNQRGLVFNYL